MLHDEEREEWERESRGVGEYAKGDPEKATGSPATWSESVPGEAKTDPGPEPFIESARYHARCLNQTLDTLQKRYDVRYDITRVYALAHRMSDGAGTWSFTLQLSQLIKE